MSISASERLLGAPEALLNQEDIDGIVDAAIELVIGDPDHRLMTPRMQLLAVSKLVASGLSEYTKPVDLYDENNGGKK